jgi:hypothetical protein
MDERQQQIRERAGLEESRLNQDFVDFLRKWGSPVLMGVALIAVGYTVWNKYKARQDTKLGNAYMELESAREGENPSPDTLLAVAEQYKDVGAVPILARLEAADTYLDAVRRGIKPGSVVASDGTLSNADDELKKGSERDDLLTLAAAQYQWVVDATTTDPAKAPHAINALYGLAAVEECRGNWDQARAGYQRIIELAKARGYGAHEQVATKRIESLSQLASLDPVPTKDLVPALLRTTPAPTPVPTPESATGAAAPVVVEPAPQPTPQPTPTSPPDKPATQPPQSPGGG